MVGNAPSLALGFLGEVLAIYLGFELDPLAFVSRVLRLQDWPESI